MDHPEEINRLFKRFIENKSSQEELKELFNYFRTSSEEDLRFLIVREMELQEGPGEEKGEEVKMQDLYRQISATINTKSSGKGRIAQWNRWHVSAAAAVAIIFIATGLYLWNRTTSPIATGSEKKALIADIQPGTNKAVLTLADGKKIALDDAKAGHLVQLSGISVTKTADGQIVYNMQNAGPDKLCQQKEVHYNSITTPAGGQFQVILPDGTKVWLNAASGIRFPMVFNPEERKVEMTGEVYFEVAAKKIPFVVSTRGQDVEVLGTHFNINAYPEEKDIRTTLLEGRVRVSPKTTVKSSALRSQILKPGEQSVNNPNTHSLSVHTVDAEEAIAWKNGLLVFNDTDIGNIMRQISRWYNVEVKYEGDVKGRQFAGSVSRYDNVSQVLAMLESTGVIHFKIEGRRITVMP
ncbi:FecR family protein [Arcticibacter tournemirensis]